MKTITVTPLVKNANNIICKENKEIKIEFEALVEDIEPDFDEPYLSKFLKKLENDSDLQYCGVSANWFCANVTVKYKHLEGTDYLGGCSYKSYDQFCKLKNDYFSDMVSNCVDQINSEIENLNANIQDRWNTRRKMIKDGVYSYFLKNISTISKY